MKQIAIVRFAPSKTARAFTAAEKKFVLKVLNDPRAWPVGRWTMASATSRPTWTVALEAQDHIDRVAGPSIAGLSVTFMDRSVSWLSYTNWTTVPGPLQGLYSLEAYRVYLILHECGHGLGLDHPDKSWALPRSGPAPVMKQQTLGLGPYRPNVWPLGQEKKILLEQ